VAVLTAACFTIPHLIVYRPKVDLTQTHRLTDATLVAALAYLRHDAPAEGPCWIGVRKDGSVVGTMGERAIRARVRVLGQQVGIANLSPHDCRHAWATSAMRGGTDVAALQDAGGWASPAMPLRYAESSAIANERVYLG
jgi:integrase